MKGSPFGPAGTESIGFSDEEELAAYRAMLLIRRFEEKAGQLYALSAIHGQCPLSIGQEGSIVGMMMAARATDPVITGYRTHGPLLARGIEPHRVMAELLGRESGLSRGKGGTVRMFAPDHQLFGGHGVAGLNATIGNGLAFAARYRDSDAVTLAFYGDGAAARGRVLEAYKIAAQWKLPIVFVVDNNTAQPGAGIALGAVPSAIAASGTPVALPGFQVDGIDVRRARSAGRRAIDRARAGEGPTILEMLTYRYRGHGGVAARPGKTERRVEDADPLTVSRARILDAGILSEREMKAFEKEIREHVSAAAAHARAAPAPADTLLHAIHA